MSDRKTLDKARALFTGATQGDTLVREVIAIAEQRESTIACEVEHSRRMEDQLKDLHTMLAPLNDAVLFASSQRRPMGIGHDFPRTEARVRLGIGIEYGRTKNNAGFWIDSDELGLQDAESPDPAKRIALALLRLAHAVADKVRT